MTASLELSGRGTYRLRNIVSLLWSSLYVSTRRLLRGPRLPGWNWALEVTVHFLRTQSRIAFDMPHIAEGREYLDVLVFHSPAVAKLSVEPVAGPVRGQWYLPPAERRVATALYLHGGGYAYYAKAHCNLIALVAWAAKARTFALDYRLIPEHPFPAQLEDALSAYEWLLASGVDPRRLLLAGDSAGGNLVLSLLLTLRDRNRPLPALALCLCPWTDLTNAGASMRANEDSDWVEKRMADQWAHWLCGGKDPRDPLLSPVMADLRGLPPLYVQAGSAEILYDMIRAFVQQAQKQGCPILFDLWQHMPHDFQAYGDVLPQSEEALARIEQIVDACVRRKPDDIAYPFQSQP